MSDETEFMFNAGTDGVKQIDKFLSRIKNVIDVPFHVDFYCTIIVADVVNSIDGLALLPEEGGGNETDSNRLISILHKALPMIACGLEGMYADVLRNHGVDTYPSADRIARDYVNIIRSFKETINRTAAFHIMKDRKKFPSIIPSDNLNIRLLMDPAFSLFGDDEGKRGCESVGFFVDRVKYLRQKLIEEGADHGDVV